MRRLVGIVGMVVSLGIMSGCSGGPEPTAQGYLNMPRLASAIREDKLYPNAVDPWENYPAEVACTKTSALGATCTLRYHEFSGSGMGQATEAVRVAADGRTYEAEEHGEIQKVGE